ncbi:MAG: DUF58 domain-containing protein [Lentisphaeria bacterium]|nr:DUF58 domain-containing protein [Lentisphaeria bacterium]
MNFGELFPPELLAAAGQWRLRPEHGGEPLSAGRHSSPFSGDSGDFRDYRDYTPGDDLRRIDWNIYRRHRKLLVRRYCDFPRRKHLLILDNSRSVRFRPARALAEWRLTALLGGMMLNSGDSVKIRIGNVPGEVSLTSGKSSFPALLAVLVRAWGEAESPLSLRFEPVAGTHVWIISDFLDPDGLEHLELVLRRSPAFTPIRICESEEEHPGLSAAVRLIDAESGFEAPVAPDPEWRKRYMERLNRFKTALELPARRGGGRSCNFNISVTLTELLHQAATVWRDAI